MRDDVAEQFLSPGAQASTGRVSAGGSFEELFLGHYGRIVAVLYRLLGDWGRAEDVTSEAFWKLYRRPLAERPEGNVPGWLYRTAMNLGIDALRSSARRKRYEKAAAEAQSPGGPGPYEEALRAERQRCVRAVLADLTPQQAQLLMLRSSGHSYKEVAEALEISPGSVGTMLVRAEAAFERRYRELFGGEEGL